MAILWLVGEPPGVPSGCRGAVSAAPTQTIAKNVISLKIKLRLFKEKCVSVLKNRLARPMETQECTPAAIGGSLSRYQVTSSVA
ncbi:MAG: hypothetical protein LUG45_11265, partial [Clostridiales bacterium]|nr:hypothetical protein [Clostridiales bacterium]